MSIATRGTGPDPLCAHSQFRLRPPRGCGLIPAGPRRGGARNRADRVSSCLTLRQCEGLIAAAAFAERIGLPFNRHWTVHYQTAGIAETDAAKFIGRLIKLTAGYAQRHSGRFAAIWVREGGETKGGHVHILMHLPARLSLKGRTRRWIRFAGGECRRGASYVRAVAGQLIVAETGGEHYAVNVAAVRDYLLKGAHPDARRALGLERKQTGGPIIGKRCGWTQNIGRGARKLFPAGAKRQCEGAANEAGWNYASKTPYRICN